MEKQTNQYPEVSSQLALLIILVVLLFSVGVGLILYQQLKKETNVQNNTEQNQQDLADIVSKQFNEVTNPSQVFVADMLLQLPPGFFVSAITTDYVGDYTCDERIAADCIAILIQSDDFEDNFYISTKVPLQSTWNKGTIQRSLNDSITVLGQKKLLSAFVVPLFSEDDETASDYQYSQLFVDIHPDVFISTEVLSSNAESNNMHMQRYYDLVEGITIIQ